VLTVFKVPAVAVALSAIILAAPKSAYAWGATGHGFLSGVAIEALPAEPDGVPAFVRTPEAAALIAALSREPDRSRGSGRIHGEERDPGHYIGADEDGAVAGVTPLSNATRTREEFDTALRSRGITQYRSGYLPYTIVDGWQQLTKNFGYWRALTALIDAPDTTPERRAWALADRKYREMLTLRDLGIWSHYVGDASQPLHVTRHSDGWGPFPNPRAFTQEAGMHLRIEGPFVRNTVSRDAISAGIRPYAACKCPFEMRVANYLAASRTHVLKMYDLAGQGAFAVPKPGATEPLPPSPEGTAFVTARLAAGASEMRDMIMDAWVASLESKVGYPEVAVRAILKTPSMLTPDVFAVD
jgi:hypothetical protein